MKPAVFFSSLLLVTAATAQDYEREKRWAAEVASSLVVGDVVQIPIASRTFLGIHTEAKTSRPAILLVHGVGVHPDHGVIGVLRVALADLGYSTLSIQMPVLHSEAAPQDYHPALFPEAAERIGAGARWLREKGQGRVVLLTHSMGSWMADAYFENQRAAPFAAWVCMGLGRVFAGLAGTGMPVLDLYGENDLAPVLRASWRRQLALGAVAGSKQVAIAGADHHYTGREKELAAVIHDFVDALK